MFSPFFKKGVEMSHTNCGWADTVELHVPYSEQTAAHGSLWSLVSEMTS